MYYFELVTIFLLFLLLGTFFSPFFGGCLVLAFVLLFFGGLIVFFSLNFVWFVLAGGLIYLYAFINKYLKWRKLPEVNQYLVDHPQCKLDVGVSCYRCGSEQLSHHGLFYSTNKLRFYSCSSCGTTLFRFKVL